MHINILPLQMITLTAKYVYTYVCKICTMSQRYGTILTIHKSLTIQTEQRLIKVFIRLLSLLVVVKEPLVHSWVLWAEGRVIFTSTLTNHSINQEFQLRPFPQKHPTLEAQIQPSSISSKSSGSGLLLLWKPQPILISAPFPRNSGRNLLQNDWPCAQALL